MCRQNVIATDIVLQCALHYIDMHRTAKLNKVIIVRMMKVNTLTCIKRIKVGIIPILPVVLTQQSQE